MEKHYFYQCCEHIAEICQPLQQFLKINNFVYLRNHADGREIRLCGNPAWLKHVYAMQDIFHNQFDTHPDNFREGFVLWSDLKTHSKILKEAEKFNIGHGITLVKKPKGAAEFYFFGAPLDQIHMEQLLIANIDLLERFILYFKDKARKILAEAEQHMLKLNKPYDKKISAKEQAFIFNNNELDREGFLNAIQVKYLILDNKVVLTKREVEVATQLTLSKTMDDIANALFLSPRTIETHLENIRHKLNCQRRSEIVSKLLELGFKPELYL